MSIEITEKITRKCCAPGTDLKLYMGYTNFGFIPENKLSFCVHCGQLWTFTEGRFTGTRHHLASWKVAKIIRDMDTGNPV